MNKFDKSNKSEKIEKQVRTNFNIRCPNIRISGTNEIITNSEAQRRARNAGLDLVEVNFVRDRDGTPVSICKIMDYGKYIYEKKKSDKLAAKKARENKSELRMIQFHLTSDDADIIRKCNKIKELIDEGDRVRAEIFFRGREQSASEVTRNLMNKIICYVKDKAVVDIPPRYEGRTYSCIFKKMKESPNQIKIKVS